MTWKELRIGLDKLISNKVVGLVWFIPNIAAMFILHLLFFLCLKSLNFRYIIGAIICASGITSIYLSTMVWFCGENMQHYAFLFLIPFVPVISFVLWKMSLITFLFGATGVAAYLIIIIIIAALFSCLMLWDLRHNNANKIFINKKIIKVFTISNGLIIICGFISYAYCILYIIKNNTGTMFIIIKTTTWFLVFYVVVTTLLCLINAINRTNFWTNDYNKVSASWHTK